MPSRSQIHDRSDLTTVALSEANAEVSAPEVTSAPPLPPRPRPVTQKQIAERVGVTQQLVALALKDSPNVASATRDKIQAAAREMGYNPNANYHARSLAAARHGTSVRSNVIAVVFENTTAVSAMGMPYFMPFVDGIEIEAGERQLDLLLVRRTGHGLPWLLRDGWVDGVILLGAHTTAGEVGRLGIPVVTLGTSLPDFPGVNPKDEDGTLAATQHLLELGHRHIAYLGPHLDRPSANARVRGFRCALQEANTPWDERLEETTLPDGLTPSGIEGMERLLARSKELALPFTALVCHNDSIAMGAIGVAQAHGLQVPTDLSVTGFDDHSEVSGFTPLLTSVSFPGAQMGRTAVELLFSSPAPGNLHHEFPVTLQTRDSTGPVR